ncbi:hypothetical protein [Noviherbaspirillum sp.]|uniref:hypothetical protein n=1 Tax=Noviherbaspirillum sp. TaxID=1926288 RepID=UPI002FE0BBB7
MLALKLFIVPAFLLLLTLAGKRWGPSVAGWLAGLPVVTGPILFFLAFEQGPVFASRAASASLSAVLASVSFSLAYSHAAKRLPWPPSLLCGLAGWTTAALLLSRLPASPYAALGVSLTTLLLAPRLFPAARVQIASRPITTLELGCRMLAGAILTVAVTVAAGAVGQAWSGLLAVFPILGIVLAAFSHQSQGGAFAAALLRGMVAGLYSFVAFCFLLAMALPHMGITGAFLVAVAATIAVQLVSKRLLSRRSGERPSPVREKSPTTRSQ